jgi:tripartite motif-containing protein 71
LNTKEQVIVLYLASRPSSSSSVEPFHPSCDWTRDGVTVLNQLKNPTGLYLDENDDNISIYVADSGNHRVIKWSPDQLLNSPVITVINGSGQLSYPRDIVIDKKDGSMFICDKGNTRIVQWMNNSKIGEVFLSNVECESLLMDQQGSLIASELTKDRVTKWVKTNEMYSSERAIAGAYGKGSNLNQLNHPRDIFYDEKDESIYISDSDNHRIVKWLKGSKQGIIVAGGNGRGNGTHQLAYPRGVALHPNGDLFIADTNNHRIVRWTQQAKSGTVIVDGNFNDFRQLPPQPFGLIFDKNYHNLYVTDWANSRLLRFFIDGIGNCGKIYFLVFKFKYLFIVYFSDNNII